MSRKKALGALLIALMIFPGPVFSGCGETAQETEPTKKETLTVAYAGASYLNDDPLPGCAEVVFHNLYPDVEVVLQEYHGVEMKELRAEIMAGKGPDLLYANCFAMDMNKMMRSGAFEDLSGYFSEGSGFDMAPYLKEAFETGKVGEKQYLIPLNFRIYALATSREMLDVSGFSMENCATLTDFLKECRTFQQNKTSTYPCLFNNPNSFWDLMEQHPDWLDYENQTVNLDAPEVREIVDFYRECLYEPQPNLVDKIFGMAVSDREAVFDVGWSYPMVFLCNAINAINNYDEANFMFVPSQSGKPVGVVTDAVLVSSTSPRKEMACAYVKSLLSANAQIAAKSPADPSVCKYAWQDGLEIFMRSRSAEDWKTRDLSTTHRIKEMEGMEERTVGQICDMLAEVEEFTLPHSYAVNEFQKLMTPYFRGDRSYESCLQDAKAKLAIYLSE